ncbi:MAG: molybdopterin dinucleotide binding domain-containing protein, partial [Candidatus Limnocylindria bacterium]
QRLELGSADAERLGVGVGDQVTVSTDGASVEATVAIRERLGGGACFLIEGTKENNANILLNGKAPTVEVVPRRPRDEGRGTNS